MILPPLHTVQGQGIMQEQSTPAALYTRAGLRAAALQSAVNLETYSST